MIVSLRMHHIALIEDLTLDFHQGLHVMTGETGAGKSIVVDAVNLVLGGRGDRELIRTGTDKAWVEAVFDPGSHPALTAFLKEQSLDDEGGYVTLYREMNASGRGLCRINGMVAPLHVLKTVAGMLMDVHGQHEHQFLMDHKAHLMFLDNSGDSAHQSLLQDVRQASMEFLEWHRKYSRLKKENAEKTHRMESLKASLTELGKAKLKPGEEEALQQEKARNRQGEKVVRALQVVQQLMNQGEDGGTLTRLKLILDELNGLASLGEPFVSLASRWSSAYYEMEEIGYEAAQHLDDKAFDPGRADQVEARLDLIRRLERKYGPTVDAILAAQEAMQEEYDRFNSMDKELETIAGVYKKSLLHYRQLARELTQHRTALAALFEEKISKELADLGMEKTVFQAAFAPPSPDGKPVMPRPEGDDDVSFLISPNPGEPLKPLDKIASGGELSRIMLAIKSLEAANGGVDSMVFDEIDTGISGRMAQVVAEKMAHIALERQVICVTHLPQIAAMADHHLLVEKTVSEGRTNTMVRQLDRQERIHEVARMMGGAVDSHASALSHGESMLDAAEMLKSEWNEHSR